MAQLYNFLLIDDSSFDLFIYEKLIVKKRNSTFSKTFQLCQGCTGIYHQRAGSSAGNSDSSRFTITWHEWF